MTELHLAAGKGYSYQCLLWLILWLLEAQSHFKLIAARAVLNGKKEWYK